MNIPHAERKILTPLTDKMQKMTWVKTCVLAIVVASFTGIMAQVRIPLPFTPVPITGQTFAVLLSALLMGRRVGGLGQVFYVGLGACGLPWFSGLSAGAAVLIGPTGGYLWGFIAASLVLGKFGEKMNKQTRLMSIFTAVVFASVFLIFVPGLIQLALWFGLVKGDIPNVGELLTMGFTPFVPGDLIKCLLVACIAKGVFKSR